ncbi:MAG: hypothetical protein N3G19_01595 [Candidatus Pacearchaeota archaeon]|nr:hypothetical protein [Candidatus Pacearchaeota archaeon]
MTKLYYKGMCIECGEGIFNPLCHECISRELDSWLKLRKQTRLKQKLLKRLSKWTKKYDVEGQKCIVCQKKKNIMCPCCFTEKIYFELKQELELLNTKDEEKRNLLKEFLIFFNYDFDKTGYGKNNC